MPIEYTSKRVYKGLSWADKQDPTLIKNWNKQDVDPVVTRWQKNEAGERVLHEEDGKPILEFVAIKRKDTDDWA